MPHLARALRSDRARLHSFTLIVVAVIAGASNAELLVAQPNARPVEILILGSYHFANPGLDVAKFTVADVMTPANQAEIERVVERLARFRPTKIAVEVVPSAQARYDSIYNAYRDGRHTLGRDERQQIGFRLASRGRLPRLHAIDSRGDFPMNPLLEFARQKDTAFVRRFQAAVRKIEVETDSAQKRLRIRDLLLRENDPRRVAEGHAMYLDMGRVGTADEPVGAALLSAWYSRNIQIYANLARIAEPGDRILVIFGSGHLPVLQELVRGNPAFRLRAAQEFLK